jgi:trans-aconitate methyltransferase
VTTDYTEYWSSLRMSHAAHPANRFRYELIAAELKKLKINPQRVVDCGCGDGSLLAAVSQAISCGTLHGMDIANNVPANVPGADHLFCQHDLGSPIPEAWRAQYDLALCSEVIEHVPDDNQVIQNLSNLLVSRAWLVLTTQSGKRYKTELSLGHLRHYKIDDLCRRLSAAGFHIEKAYRCGWPFLNLQKIVAHIFQDTVQKKVVRATTLSPPVRVVFAILHWLYGFSLRGAGPQLVIVARKL